MVDTSKNAIRFLQSKQGQIIVPLFSVNVAAWFSTTSINLSTSSQKPAVNLNEPYIQEFLYSIF
jgi:hypothetical protein